MSHFCVKTCSVVGALLLASAGAASECPTPADTSRLARPLGVAIADGFGVRRHPILGYVRPHEGLDFPAPTGTEVRAAAAGRVVLADRRGEFGIMIIVAHGAGLETRYAHLSRIKAAAGTCVAADDILGYVGNTGLSHVPHLHFEVRRDGAAFDPVQFFRSDRP